MIIDMHSFSDSLLTAGTVLRVTFSAVPSENKGLQSVIRKKFKLHGLPSFRIRACGKLRGARYYVDFTSPTDAEILTIKHEVDSLAMAYDIRVQVPKAKPLT